VISQVVPGSALIIRDIGTPGLAPSPYPPPIEGTSHDSVVYVELSDPMISSDPGPEQLTTLRKYRVFGVKVGSVADP
jgi:hypothetical protein